jgi:hypothetical protein
LQSGEVTIFAEFTGDLDRLGELSVKEFRSDTEAVTAVQFQGPPADAKPPARRIVIAATGLSGRSDCMKLSFRHEGSIESLWIRAIPAADPAALGLAGTFWPIMQHSPSLLHRVVYPIAIGHAAQTRPRLLQSADLGPLSSSGRREILVLSQGSPEALERTLIGMALTVRGHRLSIRVITTAPQAWEMLAHSLERWAREFDTPMRLEAYCREVPEATLIETPGEAELRVVCRAGAVPRRPDWLNLVLKEIRASKAGLAVAPHEASSTAPASVAAESSVLRDWDALRDRSPVGAALQGRRVAVAVLSSFEPRDGRSLRIRTLEGAIVNRVANCFARGEPVLFSAGLAFVDASLDEPCDPLSVYADQRTLQETMEQVSIPKRRAGRIRNNKTGRS